MRVSRRGTGDHDHGARRPRASSDQGCNVTGTWKPARTVQIVAGTPPGGGLDRVARALAATLSEARLLDVPVEVLNVPGDGARRAWTHCVDNHPGDGHVVGISSPNLTSDYLV